MHELVALLSARGPWYDCCMHVYFLLLFVAKNDSTQLKHIYCIVSHRRTAHTHIDMELYNHDVINSLAFDMHLERIRKKVTLYYSVAYCNVDAAFRIIVIILCILYCTHITYMWCVKNVTLQKLGTIWLNASTCVCFFTFFLCVSYIVLLPENVLLIQWYVTLDFMQQ